MLRLVGAVYICLLFEYVTTGKTDFLTHAQIFDRGGDHSRRQSSWSFLFFWEWERGGGGSKRGKTCEGKPRLVLVLLLIG